MTVDEKELKHFAQLAGHWWDEQGELKTLHHINPIRLDFIKQFIELENKAVLDVGCGGGILSEAMARVGANVCGIDRESSAVEVARQHAAKQTFHIDYYAMDLADFDRDNFDVITCLEMLEHVPKPEEIIEQCVKRLKPGGLAFFSTLNRTLKAYVTAIIGAEYLLRILPRQTHDYQKFIKPSELAKWMRAAGCELIKLQGLAYNPLSEHASLSADVAVNYLMAFKKTSY